MKRNSYCILMVLFILAACTQPEAEPQAATATQEATATFAPTSTITPEPTPTPEIKEIKMNPKFPETTGTGESFGDAISVTPENEYLYTTITLDDLLSGRLLEREKEYIEKNPPFTDSVIPVKKLSYHERNYQEDHPDRMMGEADNVKNLYINKDSELRYYNNPETRPLKIISYYPLEINEFLEKEIGWDEKYLTFTSYKWVVSWAYQNPSGKVTIGHSLVDIRSLKRIDLHHDEDLQLIS